MILIQKNPWNSPFGHQIAHNVTVKKTLTLGQIMTSGAKAGMKRLQAACAGWVAVALLTGCGGGGSGANTPTPTPAPTPTPTTLAAPDRSTPLAIYAVAHPDDAELFMGQELDARVQPAGTLRNVIIQLTAGDNSWGNKPHGTSTQVFWQVRHQGHRNALGHLRQNQNWQASTVLLAGQPVQREQLDDGLVLYQLNLRDDMRASLADLVGQKRADTTTVDGQTRYSREALKQVLGEILARELTDPAQAVVNLTEPRPAVNPRDHRDHMATAQLLQEVLQDRGQSCVGVRFYSTYINRNYPLNAGTATYLRLVEMWNQLSQPIVQAGYPDPRDRGHMAWLGKQYVTAVQRNQCGGKA